MMMHGMRNVNAEIQCKAIPLKHSNLNRNTQLHNHYYDHISLVLVMKSLTESSTSLRSTTAAHRRQYNTKPVQKSKRRKKEINKTNRQFNQQI